MKLTTRGFLIVEKALKIYFLGCTSKAKTEECEQNVWNNFDQLCVGKPGSTTDFLEVGAPVLLEVATKGFFRGKRTLEIDFFKLFF